MFLKARQCYSHLACTIHLHSMTFPIANLHALEIGRCLRLHCVNQFKNLNLINNRHIHDKKISLLLISVVS